MTLTEFLLARIGEDEAAANAAAGKRWTDRYYRSVWTGTDDDPRYVRLLSYGGSVEHWESRAPDELANATCAHAARWDPAHVLAECEAKRRIVALCSGAELVGAYRTMPQVWTGEQWMATGATDHVLMLLALPYADHPDYRGEWGVGA